MFNLFKKKEVKDPICGKIADKNFISKYGEKFCTENCVEDYEKQHQIAKEKAGGGGCCG